MWPEKAEGAFHELKNRFASPPVCHQPDPTRQVIVEVDAADVGVGLVLKGNLRQSSFTFVFSFLNVFHKLKEIMM